MFWRKKKRTEWVNPFEGFSFPRFDPIEDLFIQLPPDVVMLPLSFLKELVKPSNFGAIMRLEEDYIRGLCEDIAAYGVQKPLILAMDESKVCLRDGHHRVVAATLLEMEYLPVIINTSPGVTKHSLPIQELVRVLWQVNGKVL